MFNTELFIVEVQKRPFLWNVKNSSYTNRELKIQAWQKIAKVLNQSSDSYSHKNIAVYELQKKWKHLRDYFTREKKRILKPGGKDDSGGVAVSRRKRKSPLLDMLQFLDTDREFEIIEVNIERSTEEENIFSESNEEEDVTLSEIANLQPSKPPNIEIQQLPYNELNEIIKDKSSGKEFLTSLLPIVNTMTKKEINKFREQLMESKLHNVEENKIKINFQTHKKYKTTYQLEEVEDDTKETKFAKGRMKQDKRDEFSIYGEYVANKLRNIPNTHARHTAEFHINGVLYNAEMGEYDSVSKETRNTTKFRTKRGLSREISSTKIGESDEEHDSEDDVKSEF